MRRNVYAGVLASKNVFPGNNIRNHRTGECDHLLDSPQPQRLIFLVEILPRGMISRISPVRCKPPLAGDCEHPGYWDF